MVRVEFRTLEEQDKSSDIEQQPPFGDRANKQYTA